MMKNNLAITVIIDGSIDDIKSWFDYYILAGIEKFYVYDKSRCSGIQQEISSYIEDGFVDYVYVVKEKNNIELYLHSMVAHKSECEYMIFLEADVYLGCKIGCSLLENIVSVMNECCTNNFAMESQYYLSDNTKLPEIFKNNLKVINVTNENIYIVNLQKIKSYENYEDVFNNLYDVIVDNIFAYKYVFNNSLKKFMVTNSKAEIVEKDEKNDVYLFYRKIQTITYAADYTKDQFIHVLEKSILGDFEVGSIEFVLSFYCKYADVIDCGDLNKLIGMYLIKSIRVDKISYEEFLQIVNHLIKNKVVIKDENDHKQLIDLCRKRLKQIIDEYAKNNDANNYWKSIILYKKLIKYRKCACCGSEFDEYLPLPQYYADMGIKYGVTKKVHCEMLNDKQYTCPNCGAADRDRAYASYMLKNLSKYKKMNILEIAPAPCMSSFIKNNFPLANHITTDLFMDGVTVKMDITDMKELMDDSIDFFICSHVLEHVSDDRKAMRELKRILSANGKGILVVPIDLNQQEIDEDPTVTDVGERWRRFGQDDHVRAYSKLGYVARLKEAGFIVQEYTKRNFGVKEMMKNAFSDTATVYIVHK